MVRKGTVVLEGGSVAEAFEPLIVSAGRAGDIPAFFPEWFIERLQIGYSIWTNPFNGKKSYVSYKNTRIIVFWSKNPKPLLPYLHVLHNLGIHSYLQFTLNDYRCQGWEPGLPPLEERIETFKNAVEQWGYGKVIWRFDPLILSPSTPVEVLLEKIKTIGDCLQGFTEKLVFSFADIDNYSKVKRNLHAFGVAYRNFTETDMHNFAAGLQELNRVWKYALASCAESIDLEGYGIQHNRCIDDALMIRYFAHDEVLMHYVGAVKNAKGEWVRGKCPKDRGQRAACGCIPSKDIGAYNTCRYGCVYCYAGGKVGDGSSR
ncbi:MAG: DUF1848 domain-containing protein [Bacteroidales bacterium]|nr:DUF1848 domain-containing protein [Bacteroidales bacterium]